ncbi:MAG: FTR1 family protein [Chloroflexi bacterium]|nr:FTR1 family protein [Chloroflexota bacterium]
MFAGFLVAAREGLEASLIVGIILAYLNRTNNERYSGKVWLGVLFAILASVVVAAAVFFTIGELSGQAEELFEGLVMVAAVGILTYTILWMRRQSASMAKELREKVAAALQAGSVFGLIALAFLSVFREGLETVLFMVAVVRSSDPISSFAGAAIGIGVAVLLGYLIYTGSRRISLRAFFDITGAFLVVFAAGLVGKATVALQVAGVFPGTIPAWDSSRIIGDNSILGVLLGTLVGYTSAPSVLQVIFYLTYLALMAYFFVEFRGLAYNGENHYGDPFKPIGGGYGHWAYRILRHPAVPQVTSGVMLVAFVFLVVVAIFGLNVGPFDNQGMLHWGPFSNNENENNLFNFALWVVWLPLLSLSALFVGRFWCGNLCPLRLVADWTRDVADFLRGKPSSSKPYMRLGWLLPVTFVLITFYVKNFPVQTIPWLGAATFIAIFFVAVAVSFAFRRGIWCRYVCPIGGWLARIARLSILSLRPRLDSCAQCVAKPCLTGTTLAPRCPAFLNPSHLDSNRYCLECWNCVKNCPKERAAMHLGYRIPGAELLRPYSPDMWEAIFVAGLIGMYIGVVAQGAILPQLPWGLVYFGLIALAIGVYLVVCALVSSVSGMRFPEAIKNLGYVALPLEFSMAILAFGDDALSFFGITVPAAALLLGLGFMWSVLLLASILRHQIRNPWLALRAAVPMGLVLVGLLFLWSQWFLAGVVLDLT